MALKPLQIVVLPSPRLAVLLSILHLGAATTAMLVPIPVWLKLVLTVVVAWSLRHALDDVALLRTRRATTVLRVNGKGHLFAQTRGGAWLECELLPSSYVSSGLTILNLRDRCHRQLRHVVLCCGNANSADVRRLRTWLRWGAGNQ